MRNLAKILCFVVFFFLAVTLNLACAAFMQPLPDYTQVHFSQEIGGKVEMVEFRLLGRSVGIFDESGDFSPDFINLILESQKRVRVFCGPYSVKGDYPADVVGYLTGSGDNQATLFVTEQSQVGGISAMCSQAFELYQHAKRGSRGLNYPSEKLRPFLVDESFFPEEVKQKL